LTPDATPNSRSSTSSRIAACREATFSFSLSATRTTPGRPAGAVAKAAPTPEAHQKLEGSLEVSVDCHGDDPGRIAAVLKGAGAKVVWTK
jgi:hypothetical protein